MAKTIRQLTNTEVKQAKAKDKEYNLADGLGLMLRVKPNGTKLWIFNYYHPVTKKRKSISFGRYPDVSIADARERRSKARELLADNIDPKEQREESAIAIQQANLNTLEKIAADWFEIKKSKIAEVTAVGIWRNFSNHLFPELGHRPIDKITAPEAIKVLQPLAAKGSLETVTKLVGHVNEVMTHAVNTGIINHNALAGIKAAFKSPKATNLPALRPDELPELMQTLTRASIKTVTRCLIEWQLHTMVRPSEAAGTTWAEIDFDTKTWNIPAERMKMKREHTIPLTDQTIALLEYIRPISGNRTHVFPADRKPNEASNPQTANMALKRMGFQGRLVAHGLRSIASTTLNEQAFEHDVIEAALAHTDANEVRRAYNRTDYLERRRAMMAWWSQHIDNAATGNMSIAGLKGLKVVGQ